MTNIIKTLLFLSLCVCLGVSSGCGKSPVEPPVEEPPIEEPIVEEPPEPEPRPLLLGMEWKLMAFVDVATGTIKKPEPDIEKCYRLLFESNVSFSGFSSNNLLEGSYSVDYKESLVRLGNIHEAEAYEYPDGELYRKALGAIESFVIQDSELRLYYNSKKNYLLFNSNITDRRNSYVDDADCRSECGSNSGVLDSISCKGKDVLAVLENEPAFIIKGCFSHFGRFDSYCIYLVNEVKKPGYDNSISTILFTSHPIPEEFRVENLPVLVSGNILDYADIDNCFSCPNCWPAPTNIFKLDSIKIDER